MIDSLQVASGIDTVAYVHTLNEFIHTPDAIPPLCTIALMTILGFLCRARHGN